MPRINDCSSSVVKWLSVSLGVFLLAACGAHRNSRVQSAAQAVAEITRQADAWDKAIVQKDMAAVAANMTDDFRIIRSNGDISNKEGFLRGVEAPTLTINPYTVEDFDVRLYGDMALVCGRTRMTGISSGVSFTLNYRYIDTYIRADGTWKVCHVQITEIPPRPTP